jgi:hypothetical protein
VPILRSEGHQKTNEGVAVLEDDTIVGLRDSYRFCFGKVSCVLRCRLGQ